MNKTEINDALDSYVEVSHQYFWLFLGTILILLISLTGSKLLEAFLISTIAILGTLIIFALFILTGAYLGGKEE